MLRGPLSFTAVGQLIPLGPLGLLFEAGLVVGVSAGRIDDYALRNTEVGTQRKAFQLGPESSATEMVLFALGAVAHSLGESL